MLTVISSIAAAIEAVAPVCETEASDTERDTAWISRALAPRRAALPPIAPIMARSCASMVERLPSRLSPRPRCATSTARSPAAARFMIAPA